MNGAKFRGIGMTSQRTRERLINDLEKGGISDARVLNAMREVPRHIFIDEAMSNHAYRDISMPIGYGQTISQPSTVARMTEVVMQSNPGRVLEVGTGCGYQSAVLARLVRELYTIERLGPLKRRAAKHLSELGIHNVQLRHGDGYKGWPSAAPFDAILVAAAAKEMPQQLKEQLADGGQMVIPIGDTKQQSLLVVTRQGSEWLDETLVGASFVPMLYGHE